MGPDYNLKEKRISHPFNKPSKKVRASLFYKVSLRFRQKAIHLVQTAMPGDSLWWMRLYDKRFSLPQVVTKAYFFPNSRIKNPSNAKKSHFAHYHQVICKQYCKGFYVTIQISNSITLSNGVCHHSLGSQHRKHEK